MRVLITGGRGNLGQALAPVLLSAGHDPVLLDLDADASTSAPPAGSYLCGDVRNPAEVAAAMEDVDVVVHAAAWHGIHLATHSAQDFFDLNILGTYNVWQAAVQARVKAFVFSSTMGVYGDSRRPATDDSVVVVHEDLPLLPGDIYGYSKVVGEQMSSFHQRVDGIPSVSLRYGMFVPEPFFRYGVRLLYGGVDERDVAQAVLMSIQALLEGRIEYDAFNIESDLPFGAGDAAQLRHEPLTVLDRHYPGSASLLRARGVTRLRPVTEWFPMRRIASRIGFRPRHNFGEWLEELARRPTETATGDPPWP